MTISFRFVTFLSDYGYEDEFVGICHGVLKRIAPEVEVIDIGHGIPPQDVEAGALVLGQAVTFMPPAVHVAVVDPRVGTDRRAVVIGTRAGPPLVGPDNGVLWLAAEALGGAVQAHSIEREELLLTPVSRTFQGRDVFMPVAARLALGMPPEDVGPEVPVDSLVRFEMPKPRVDDDHVHGQVVQTDHFGNLQLNVHRQELEDIGVLLGDRLEIRIGGKSHTGLYCLAFAEVPLGRFAVLEDSYRLLSIGMNRGSATRVLQAARGDAVIFARLRDSAR
ncbi:MAG: SAM-dependent chlorinase/fluorinase [Acidobacteria bacterium]|nr:SAM-dependent chlorinase/fluorinase [Acidobacteriota bacterium]